MRAGDIMMMRRLLCSPLRSAAGPGLRQMAAVLLVLMPVAVLMTQPAVGQRNTLNSSFEVADYEGAWPADAGSAGGRWVTFGEFTLALTDEQYGDVSTGVQQTTWALDTAAAYSGRLGLAVNITSVENTPTDWHDWHVLLSVSMMCTQGGAPQHVLHACA